METKAGRRSLTWLLLTWGVTRLLLLLWVFKVYVFPGPDVTSDVSVIYQGWYDVLRTGTFPQSDVTWQYPPAAALAILSPRCCPSWSTPRPSSSSPSPPTWPSSSCCCTRACVPGGGCGEPGCGWRAYPCSARPSTPATT